VAAQDTERQRLQRDLHDGVQQEVVSLLARLGLARSQLRRDATAADGTLAELQTHTGQILEELRELAHGIDPPVLTDRGLLEALESRLSRIPIGVEIHAERGFRGRRFPREVEAAAYFFVTEALANALKHSRARRVSVGLSVTDTKLIVEVADDGVGFRPADVRGSGLIGLRDRIEALGGAMHVHARPAAGCRLTATVPTAPVRTDSHEVG
jgi:signal transduction histidine kinase